MICAQISYVGNKFTTRKMDKLCVEMGGWGYEGNYAFKDRNALERFLKRANELHGAITVRIEEPFKNAA